MRTARGGAAGAAAADAEEAGAVVFPVAGAAAEVFKEEVAGVEAGTADGAEAGWSKEEWPGQVYRYARARGREGGESGEGARVRT